MPERGPIRLLLIVELGRTSRSDVAGPDDFWPFGKSVFGFWKPV
jgi:hypothetical protein